jgi:hypothetical protein
LMSTSSSNPRSSVTLLAIQGFITSILTFDMSTYHQPKIRACPQNFALITAKLRNEAHEWTNELTKWSSSGANFCVLSSLACLLEKRVSWSADVPCAKTTGNQRGLSHRHRSGDPE